MADAEEEKEAMDAEGRVIYPPQPAKRSAMRPESAGQKSKRAARTSCSLRPRFSQIGAEAVAPGNAATVYSTPKREISTVAGITSPTHWLKSPVPHNDNRKD